MDEPVQPQPAHYEGQVLGDCRLLRASSEGQLTQTWEAEQVSMRRQVMLEILKEVPRHDERVVAGFLADVRAKALVRHPVIGAVYEAVSTPEHTFFSRERLEGMDFQRIHASGRKFTPLEVVKILEGISDAMIYLKEMGVATVDHGLHHLVLDPQNKVRMMNLAVEGPRDGAVDTRTKQLLGMYFEELRDATRPGATRVASLCGLMIEGQNGIPLTWAQILKLCRQVEGQLESQSDEEKAQVVARQEVELAKRSGPTVKKSTLWALFGGVGLIGALVLFLLISGGNDKPVEPVTKEEELPYVEIAAGEYDVFGEKVILRKGFRIEKTEVTISQYQEFLEAENLASFAHPDDPTLGLDPRRSREPKDWLKIMRAAVKRKKWNGVEVSVESPVVLVNWWDAYAYAKWKGGRLPTSAEWRVAAVAGGASPKVGGWSEVTDDDGDVTGLGLKKMAGGVSEWTEKMEVDPDFSLSPKKPVVVGASYNKPKNGASHRAYVPDREFRNWALGFRIVLED